MRPALLIRLRPVGPWRFGPGEGGHERSDALYRSDRVYSAVSLAMRQLGWLEEWLAATARSLQPAVTFTSLFPYQGDTLFAPPPATVWPPPAELVRGSSPVFLAKIRWSAARFVPTSLIEGLATGQTILADQWVPDAESGCLLRRDRPTSSPFRQVIRSTAAVDRVTQAAVDVRSTTCVEFEPGSGLWAVSRFESVSAGQTWSERVKAAFRLLVDTGFGGRRTSGWGQSATPEFQEGAWPAVFAPKLQIRNGDSAAAPNGDAALYWMLSLYSPASADAIDWKGGDYQLSTRGGRVESPQGSGVPKKVARMIVEGSVLAARSEPVGTAVDVAPDGFAHPVYRSGLAVAVKLPEIEPDRGLVKQPATEEAVEARPCEPAAADAPAPAAAAAETPQTEPAPGEAAGIEPEAGNDAV